MEETGMAADSSAPNLILSCIKAIRQFADFNKKDDAELQSDDSSVTLAHDNSFNKNEGAKGGLGQPPQRVGFNVGYNINLNLPATSDIAVFNAIFKSLKENLLPNDDV